MLHKLLYTWTKCRQQEFTWSDGIWKLLCIEYESTQKTNNNKKLSFASALEFYSCWQRREIWPLISCIYRCKYSYKYKRELFSKEVVEIEPAVIINNISYWLYKALGTLTLHLVTMKSLMYGMIWNIFSLIIIAIIIIIIIIVKTIIFMQRMHFIYKTDLNMGQTKKKRIF